MLSKLDPGLGIVENGDGGAARAMRVFVHLAHGFDSRSWAKKYDDGKLIGINERLPYGYHRADAKNLSVAYSKDANESAFQRFLRLSIRGLLGFDFVHAWRNREEIYRSDVIWTHTESQHLAVAACLLIAKKHRMPKLIAQSVWLFDRWPNLFWPRRWLFKNLMKRANVLTVHSPDNLRMLKELMPEKRAELIRYGIRTDEMCAPKQQDRLESPIRLLAIGNDRHRDWRTLAVAMKDLNCCKLNIVSETIPRKYVSELRNTEVASVDRNEQLMELYEWADIAVVPLKHNRHASGITVIQEAVLRGVPVICSKVGGLTAYYCDRQVEYVPSGDPVALRRAILRLAADSERRSSLVRNAQAAMGPDGLSSWAFVRRHVELSVEIVGDRTS